MPQAETTMTKPLIYLVMLNWNGKRHLEYSIPSVLQTDYPNYRLVLVDNASQDGSVSFVQQNYPHIEIVMNKRNLGWAGGNNVGIRHALERGAEWVVLINNDILVDPWWLNDAIEAAQSDARVGLIGFEVFGEYLKTPREAFYAAQAKYESVTLKDTDAIVGCALMVKAEVFQHIGLVDEVYFMYEDEVDFELRASSAGWRMVRTNVPLWHYSEGSGGAVRLRSAYLSARNWLRCGIKNRNWGIRDVLRWTAGRFWFSCSPFAKVDYNNTVHRRARPSHPFINFWIVVAALGWNLLHLRQTFEIRKVDQARIRQARSDRFCQPLAKP